MNIPRIDYSNPDGNRYIFGDSIALASSRNLGWDNLYFEEREMGPFETRDHQMGSHYLMVKINSLTHAERRIDGRVVKEVQRRGALAYLPAGCDHAVCYPKSTAAARFLILPEAAVARSAQELGISDYETFPQAANTDDEFILAMAGEIAHEVRDGNPHGKLFADVASHSLAIHILRKFRVRSMETKEPAYQIAPCRMRWIYEYIEANLSSDLPLKALAAEVGLSLHYFCRGFKQVTGVSPHQYVLAKRLETAATLITETDTQLADIAAAVGFADASSFGKAFRKRFSLTPGDFRRVHKNI